MSEFIHLPNERLYAIRRMYKTQQGIWLEVPWLTELSEGDVIAEIETQDIRPGDAVYYLPPDALPDR